MLFRSGASTAAPLYALLRIKNRVKTKDAHFVQDYCKQILFFLNLPFFYFFHFLLFVFFWFFVFFFFFTFAILDFSLFGFFFIWLGLVCLGCWLAQDLNLVSPRMLIA